MFNSTSSAMTANVACYRYRGDKPFKLLKWKVKSGSQIFANTVILTFNNIGESTELKLKSDSDGTVISLLVKEGDTVQPGANLLELQSCTHEIIMKELCAQCGADLRQLSRQSLQEVVASRSFSMVHIVPELKCSLKQASQLDEADEVRLFKSRKLVLLVDLDQTLIHTTNEDVPPDSKDVYHFQLYGAKSPWYHTKLRPATRPFLEKVSKFYELHIFTFGARMYAHKIASILDPDGKLFSHRILSRDECFDPTSKTGNLKTMFPRGDNMVCIIDDREDVWNFTPNVVHVKPYIYFRNTGDINAPPQSNRRFPRKATKNCAEQVTPNELTDVIDTTENNHLNGSQPVTDDPTVKDPEVVTEPIAIEDLHGSSLQSGNEVSDSKEEDNNHQTPDAPSLDSSISENEEGEDVSGPTDDDDDDYLLYLEDILITIHKAYFNIYDELTAQGSTTIPDLKNIIPYVKRKVLQGVNIVFSGIIPTNMPPEKSMLWLLAKSFGASVCTDLILEPGKKQTTHIIATKMGTAKLNKAKRAGSVHIVTPSWLICCAMRWERADERLFPLKKGPNVSPDPIRKYKKTPRSKAAEAKSRNSSGSPKNSKRKKNDAGAVYDGECSNPSVLNFSSEELEHMGREVEELCGDSDDESDSEDEAFNCTEISEEPVTKRRKDSINNVDKNGSVPVTDELQCSDNSCSSSSYICSEDEQLTNAAMSELFSTIPNANS